MRGIFSKYGQIRDVYIPADHFTGRIRGFAYVEYPLPLTFSTNCFYVVHLVDL